YAEIAELLELAPGTVRSRIARGRAKLAALVEAAGGSLTDNPRSTDSTGNAGGTDSTGGNPSAHSDVRLQDQP
ncbi:MAG: RNA polymerase sigma factor, partial [Microthrixaceae bacterium]